MDENLNNNKEVSEALEEINLNQQAIEQKRSTIDSDEAARKVQEALREFELQQQTLREKQQPTEVPKPQGESLNAKADIEMDKLLTEFEVKSAVEQKQKKTIKDPNIPEDASSMEKLVMKISGGLIKEKRQASFVLLIFALLVFLASGYFFYIGLKGNAPKTQPIPSSMLDKTK